MDLYIRFVTTLAFGLVGLGMVLMILLERVFHDWDAFADLSEWVRSWGEGRRAVAAARAEDLLLEIEKSKQPGLVTNSLIDIRREQLREIDLVESRLKRGAHKVVLSPIAPPPASAAPGAS